MSQITAPFTPRQVEILNQYQQAGIFHPFTCGNRENHIGEDVLIAKEDGWHCPTCDYTQDWAHEFMADSKILSVIAARLGGRRIPLGCGTFPPIEEKAG